MATFNPNRKTGGTIQLIRDADGNYSTQEVGFNELTSLSLPDFKTTTTAETTTTEAKDATEITGDTIGSQTQLAFNMGSGGDTQPDTTGEMLQKSAEQTSRALTDTFADTRGLMTSDDAYRGTRMSADQAAPQENILDVPQVKSPTERVFRSETDRFKEEFDPTKIDSTLAVDKDLKGSAAVQRGDIEPPGLDFSFILGDRFKERSSNRPSGIDTPMKESMTRDEMLAGATADEGFTLNTRAAKEADFASGKPGISTREAKEAGFASGTYTPKRSALETVSTSLRTTKDSVLSKIKTPMMMLIDAAATPRNETEAAVDFNKRYFNVREDGRIAGNPATDLFAGMNRVSAFGNLNQAGAKRIERREKTIATKNVSQKFIDDTNKMKEQLNDYREGRARDRDEKSGGRTKTNVTGFGKTGLGRDTDYMGQGGGGDSSGGGGKIVCTMMNESYGFGSFRNKIWLRHSKNLAPEYQIGYHKIFLPLVKKAKTNKILKKVLEHIAIHRTIDIRQQERNKIHLLGRVYRTILEPICYWVGKL